MQPSPRWIIRVGSGLSAFGALKTSGIRQRSDRRGFGMLSFSSSQLFPQISNLVLRFWEARIDYQRLAPTFDGLYFAILNSIVDLVLVLARDTHGFLDGDCKRFNRWFFDFLAHVNCARSF